jgi:hypothetical protein
MVGWDPISNGGTAVRWVGAALIGLGIVFVPARQSLAQSAASGSTIDFEALATQPGTELTRSHDANGDEILELHRGGVVITQRFHDGKAVKTETVDRSGKDAVFCVWELWVSLREDFATCYPDSHPDIHEELDSDLEDINRFIVANDIFGTSMDQIQARIDQQHAGYEAEISKQTPARIRISCRSGNRARALDSLIRIGSLRLHRKIADVLSIPRPPVSNPCL